jgi:hypothetical protein
MIFCWLELAKTTSEACILLGPIGRLLIRLSVKVMKVPQLEPTEPELSIMMAVSDAAVLQSAERGTRVGAAVGTTLQKPHVNGQYVRIVVAITPEV